MLDVGPRYAILGPLGRGAQGSVWLVEDRRVPGRRAAIKVLAPDGDSAHMLRHEYGLLAQLRHPGLPAVYELGRAPDGRSFLVFEHVDGRPLGEWWTGRPQAEVLGVVAQLLGTLDFLHRRGVVHRDVKPDNVLVQAQGVKLVDLGLAASGRDRAELSGTPGYIAPELLAGEAASPRSDLYAVGVLLFQAIWSRPPFDGSPAEVVARQLKEDVALPASGAPPGLRALVGQLLDRRPARRPATAAEVLALLEEVEPEAISSADHALVGQGLPAPTLVGREAALERLEAALARLADAAPLVQGLLVVGHPGEGRTRLCEELACRAALRGVRVLRGLHREDTEVESVGPAPEPAAEGARAVERAVDHVRSLAAEGPVLLVVEQAADALQIAILLALRRLEDLPLLLCATATKAGALAPEFEPVELGPLDEQQVAELVRSMLPARWVSEELAAQVFRLSGGNPQMATELTRLAVARQLERGRGVGPEVAAALAAEEVEGRAAELARLRVRSLAPQQARAAALVALFDEGLPLALCDVDREVLAQLQQQGILQPTESGEARLRIAAGSTRTALIDGLSLDERRELGQRAQAILRQASSPLRQQALALLRCGLAGEQPELMLAGAREARRALELDSAARLYQAALQAGLQLPDVAQELAALLLATGEAQRAVELLEEVARAAEGAASVEVRCALADARLRAGDTKRGLADVEGIEGPRADALRAKLLLFDGRYTEALELAQRIPPDAEADLVAEAEHTRGLAHYYQGELEQAQQALGRALELARRAAGAAQLDDERAPRRALTEARVTNSLALVHQRRSAFDEARSCYTRCIELARQLGHLPFEATFLMNLGSVAQQQGDRMAALESYKQSLEVAARFGGARETAQVRHNLGRLLAQLGQTERGEAHVHRSLQLARALGWRSLEAHNLTLRGELALERAALGDLEDLRAAEAIFDELGDLSGGCEARLARARGELVRGRTEEAVGLATAVTERAPGIDSLQIQARVILGRAELERPEGSARQAVAHLREALRVAEATGEQDYLVELHHTLARACAAAEDAVGATVHREASLRLLRAEMDRVPESLRPAFARAPLRAAVLAEAGDTEPIRVQPVRRSGALDAELLVALLEINKELNAETDLQRLLERIIDHAVDLTGAERGFLLLVGEDAGALQIEVARNIDQETIRRKEFKISRSVAEEVLGTGRPLITVNAMGDDRFKDFLSVHNLRLRSILCVPMSIRRRVRGAIYLDNRFQQQAFSETHQELLMALADQAALAVGNRELMEQNQRHAQQLRQSQTELERVNQQLKDAMERQSLELDELARLAQSQQGELEGRYQFDNLVGQSAAMRELFRLMDRVKDSEAPVYIHGESGTGKELVAKALHYNGPRRDSAFVSVNCGAIPPTLLESELFGYEKGAFTGAERRHRGLFERSHGGSLFLDEVGDMPAELQVKLLRVLQEKRFQPVGGEREQEADFRLLAASNKDLGELVRAGVFREDLYYRINVIQLRLPPLRERREDIPLLVEHLLRRHGGGERQVSRVALNRLLDHDWPGNVRELENELLRSLALGGPVINTDDLSPRLGDPHPQGVLPQDLSAGLTLKQALAELERSMAIEALRACGGNVTEAARRLGMTRVGLHKLMGRHKIRREDVA